MAGFEVTLYGRFWVTTEGQNNLTQRMHPVPAFATAHRFVSSSAGMIFVHLKDASIHRLIIGAADCTCTSRGETPLAISILLRSLSDFSHLVKQTG